MVRIVLLELSHAWRRYTVCGCMVWVCAIVSAGLPAEVSSALCLVVFRVRDRGTRGAPQSAIVCPAVHRSEVGSMFVSAPSRRRDSVQGRLAIRPGNDEIVPCCVAGADGRRRASLRRWKRCHAQPGTCLVCLASIDTDCNSS